MCFSVVTDNSEQKLDIIFKSQFDHRRVFFTFILQNESFVSRSFRDLGKWVPIRPAPGPNCIAAALAEPLGSTSVLIGGHICGSHVQSSFPGPLMMGVPVQLRSSLLLCGLQRTFHGIPSQFLDGENEVKREEGKFTVSLEGSVTELRKGFARGHIG